MFFTHEIFLYTCWTSVFILFCKFCKCMLYTALTIHTTCIIYNLSKKSRGLVSLQKDLTCTYHYGASTFSRLTPGVADHPQVNAVGLSAWKIRMLLRHCYHEWLLQRCANSARPVACLTTFFIVATICGYSIWQWLHVTFLASRILRRLIRVSKICGVMVVTLLYSHIFAL